MRRREDLALPESRRHRVALELWSTVSTKPALPAGRGMDVLPSRAGSRRRPPARPPGSPAAHRRPVTRRNSARLSRSAHRGSVGLVPIASSRIAFPSSAQRSSSSVASAARSDSGPSDRPGRSRHASAGTARRSRTRAGRADLRPVGPHNARETPRDRAGSSAADPAQGLGRAGQLDRDRGRPACSSSNWAAIGPAISAESGRRAGGGCSAISSAVRGGWPTRRRRSRRGRSPGGRASRAWTSGSGAGSRAGPRRRSTPTGCRSLRRGSSHW